MVEWLERAFPGLRGTAYRVTSPPTDKYNCIAWAAGASADWWWPLDESQRTYWPSSVPREVSVDAFVAAFATLGYSICSDDFIEPEFEKVALFANPGGLPTHAARQLPTGRWTSKLGQSGDIEHDLRALEGQIYGTVAVILRRPGLR